MKTAISKEKVACSGSGQAIFELCNRIFSRKRKSLWNRFCLFLWGPGWIFLGQTNGQNSCDTVPLSTKHITEEEYSSF